MVVEELIAKLVVAKGLVSAEALDSLRGLRDSGDGRPLEVMLVEERLVGHDTLQELLEEVWGQAGVDSSESDSWDMTQVSTHASDTPAKAAGEIAIGQVLTLRPGLPLLVRAVLGRGGMGVVYLVMDPALRRLCALKLTLAEATVKNRSGRFQRETVVTAGLDHPGIPAVFEAGATESGRSFLLMQYLPGRSLKDRLGAVWKRGAPADSVPLSALRSFLQNLVRVCEAVGYAHSRGVVHRDLKPANVMLGQFGRCASWIGGWRGIVLKAWTRTNASARTCPGPTWTKWTRARL